MRNKFINYVYWTMAIASIILEVCLISGTF